MVKHLTRPILIEEIRQAINGSPHPGISRADGRAGLLLEKLLGIEGGNHDVADAVGFELKTSISPNTPVTLFHKEALPRGNCTTMVHRFGWPAEYGGEKHPVTSFRATIYGEWTSKYEDITLRVVADNTHVAIMSGQERVAYWKSDDLAAAAAAKLRNMMLLFARDNGDGTISFTSANLLENFQPFKFIEAINAGRIAIEYDARTKPNSTTVRNHGTKFRIRERDLHLIYTHVETIS
jgi:hypothetical protein